MSNNNFDINDIVYANNYSKITLKSKKILDELAAQVALWNLETHQMPFMKKEESKNFIKNDKLNFKELKLLTISNQHFTPKNLLNDSNLNSKNTLKDSKGLVKKHAAYFESLSTPIKTEKSIYAQSKPKQVLKFPLEIDESNFNYCSNLSLIDKENEEPQNECFPPPPPDFLESDDDEIKYCLPTKISSLSITTDNESPIISYHHIQESPQDIGIDEFNYFLPLTPSRSTCSLYNDFVNEWKKINESESQDSIVEKSRKNLRRSLSFNDTIEYIYPSSADDSEEVIQSDRVNSISSSVFEMSRSFTNVTQSEETGFWSEHMELEMVDLKKQGKDLLEKLKVMLGDYRFEIGGKIHTEICRRIVHNVLVTKSLAEKIHMGPVKSGAILGTLNMQNIQFAVKEGYVLIDYEELLKQGHSDKLQRFTSIFHMVLFVRCFMVTSISESKLYTLVNKVEAIKLGIAYQNLNWLEMFYIIDFQRLLAGFRLMFELHCMHVTPKKQLLKNKGTPRKKNMFCNSPSEIDRLSFFTNIGSFEISAKGLISNDEVITKKLNVPQHYPFSGKMKFMGSLSLGLNIKCEGRLNIFMEVGGVGSWSFRDCEISHTSIIGGKRSEDSGNIEDVDVIIPFYMCSGCAMICDYSICAKANSFSVLLHEGDNLMNTYVNRRLSTDGKKKNRFLAAAESYDDAVRWCNSINDAKESFVEWANDIDSL